MKMIKETIIVVVMLFSCTLSSAFAGPYISVGLGHSSLNETNANDDIGKALNLGYQFKYLGLEGGYVDFGNTDSSSLSLNTDLSGFEVALTARLRYGRAAVFGKLGLWNWDFETTIADQSETDTLHGMGIDYAFSSKLMLRGEYTEYRAKDSAANLGLVKLMYHW